ncbi:hypothetical protein BC567DRAFT_293456 [Phyllosticta citribraziliensis]
MANKRYNLRRRPGERANSGDAGPPADNGEQPDSTGQVAEASSARQPEEPPQAPPKKGKARRKPVAEESSVQQAKAPSQQEPAQEPQKKKKKKKKKRPKVSKWASQRAMNKMAYKSAPQATKPTRKPKSEKISRGTENDLNPYEKYPHLYEERKNSRAFVRQTQTLSFTDDLPPEIRLMVYRYLPGIDVDVMEIYHYGFQGSGMRDLRSQCPAFKMMRLCRMIYTEIGQILYGKILKFAGPSAFFAMGAFMFSHQSLAFQNVRHIIVEVPALDLAGLNRELRASKDFRKIILPGNFSVLRYKSRAWSTAIVAFQKQCTPPAGNL